MMPFTIMFHNWRGVKSFDQMNPTAAAKQFGMSYQPVLLSWEQWQPKVYAGATTPVFVHVVNDADDFSDLCRHADLSGNSSAAMAASPGGGQLECRRSSITAHGAVRFRWCPRQCALDGQYKLIGQLKRRGQVISTNETPIFVADRSSRHIRARR